MSRTKAITYVVSNVISFKACSKIARTTYLNTKYYTLRNPHTQDALQHYKFRIGSRHLYFLLSVWSDRICNGAFGNSFPRQISEGLG